MDLSVDHDRAGAASRPPSHPVRVSLKRKAYDEIKGLIVTLKLRPGERINEQAISDMIGIGKTPVGQALQMLSAQGFVQILPRKGILIASDTLNDSLAVLEARIVIETEMARFAAQRADLRKIGDLERIVSASHQAVRGGDLDAFIRLDRNFHEAVWSAADNAILSATLTALHDRISRIWHLRPWKMDNLQRTQEHHTAVFTAIAGRNPADAAEAMRDHIATLRRDIIAASLRPPDLVD